MYMYRVTVIYHFSLLLCVFHYELLYNNCKLFMLIDVLCCSCLCVCPYPCMCVQFYELWCLHSSHDFTYHAFYVECVNK